MPRWLTTLATSLLAACTYAGEADYNFSQYPGFEAYFEVHPRAAQAPGAAERALLRRYRPRLHVGAGQEGPIGFYTDYIGHGRLYAGDGRLISESVTPDLLNRYRNDPGAVFEHHRGTRSPSPVVLGRVDRDTVPGVGELRFLTYHFVFRYSGLPAGLPAWQEIPLRLIADPADWHQLDHYTAATLVLDSDAVPVAVILQQHNNQRSYIIGPDIRMPDDGRIRITAALRSNELYPWHEDCRRYRTVRFMTPESARYLVTGKDKPGLTADDITDPARSVDYEMRYLAQTDAFYSFAGFLGERRRLPGRDGPPGADYKTLPAFMARAVQLVVFNWRENDHEQLRLMTAFAERPEVGSPFWQKLVKRFRQRLNQVRRN